MGRNYQALQILLGAITLAQQRHLPMPRSDLEGIPEEHEEGAQHLSSGGPLRSVQ